MRRLGESDPRKELRRQQRLLLVLERRYSRRFKAEIARASRLMLDQFGRTGAAPSLPDETERRLSAAYEAMARDAVRLFGGDIIDQGKAAGLVLETKFSFREVFERLALEYISDEMIRRRITRVADNTRSDIVAKISAGQREGLGVAEIAKGIVQAIPGIATRRGALIARTETHGAANYGADSAARATGLTLQKEWIAAEDERTRADHAEADGQMVAQDQPFTVGGERMMFPGDPAASAAQVCNCRCGMGHIVVD